MGKTNHRVNKDREEKLGEAKAHKQRRGVKQELDRYMDYYHDPHAEIDLADELADELIFEPSYSGSVSKRQKNG